MPVLVVAGELDVKYVQLAHRLAGAIGPSARLAIIPGAGHACHLERTDQFLSVVQPFLEGC
jgi:2-succinyl-6-hydroxy-2,4-cyclohexadiene-1-carboxylate synthase